MAECVGIIYLYICVSVYLSIIYLSIYPIFLESILSALLVLSIKFLSQGERQGG